MNGPSTYRPSVEAIGPRILFFVTESELIRIQASKVYSLYCPASDKNPKPGTITDGRSAFGKSFVKFDAPYTSGIPVFFAIRLLSLTI